MTPNRPLAPEAARPPSHRPSIVRLAALAASAALCIAALAHVQASPAASAGTMSAHELVRFVVNESQWVYSADSRVRIEEIALDGTGRRQIAARPGTALWASTSCASTLVIQVFDAEPAQRTRMIVVDRGTGDWWEHLPPDPGSSLANEPALHPTGNKMWFWWGSVVAQPAFATGIWQASLVDAAMSLIVPQSVGDSLNRPAWSPRGDAVVITKSDRNFFGPSDLVLYDAQGREIEQLTHFRDAKEGSLSPGSTHVVFSRNQFDQVLSRHSSAIWMLERSTGRAWPLIDDGHFNHHPVWSNDGSTIVYVQGGSWYDLGLQAFKPPAHIMTIPARGGTPTLLVEGDDGLAMWPATCVSPEWDDSVARPEPPAELDLPDCMCPHARRRLPATVLASAMANPSSVYGWNLPLDPNKPISPANPRRRCLSLLNAGEAFHYLDNPPTWRAGCSN